MFGNRMMRFCVSIMTVGGVLAANQGKGDEHKATSYQGFLLTAILGGIVAAICFMVMYRNELKALVSQILGSSGYILHVYDHCPFCVRVELALAFLGLPYTRVLYGYGDMDGPKRLMGKKQLPVMEYKGKYTEESLDIIGVIEKNTSHKEIPPKTDREDLGKWLKDSGEIRRTLCRPRIIKVPIKDWAEDQDVAYAKQKYEKKGFNYADAEARSDELIVEMNQFLESFNNDILHNENSVNEEGFGIDDILVIPHIRTLTCVKGLKWPEKLRKYLESNFKNVTAELYFKYAV